MVLCKHFGFFGQLNKTNPKYNHANIYHSNYKNTISIYIYLIINSTIFTATVSEQVIVYTPPTVCIYMCTPYAGPIQTKHTHTRNTVYNYDTRLRTYVMHNHPPKILVRMRTYVHTYVHARTAHNSI